MDTQRTLRITAETERERQEAWALLGENALLFGDDGGDPDGDWWLPVEPLDESDAGVNDVIAAGLGEMVDAVFTTTEQWHRAMYEANPTISSEEFEDWMLAEDNGAYEAACGAIANSNQGYAGYSSAGVIVYVPFTDKDWRVVEP